MSLNERSLKNLEGVHAHLVDVVKEVSDRSKVPIVVTEGLRNAERQRELVAAGKSWTLDSRHLTGHAVDLVDADDFKYDIPDMTYIAGLMKAVAKEKGVPIVWGGDWKQRDTPHFELDRKAYPASGVGPVTKAKEVATKVVTSTPVVAGSGVAGGAVATDSIPAPPDLTAVSAWHTFGQTVSSIGTWIFDHPVIATALIGWVGSIVFWTRIKAFAAGLFAWRTS